MSTSGAFLGFLARWVLLAGAPENLQIYLMDITIAVGSRKYEIQA